MQAITGEGTIELLTRAADAAGKAAGDCEAEATGWLSAPTLHESNPDYISKVDARLIAASSPDHWAVEALLRTVLALHPSTSGDVETACMICATCVNLGEHDNWPCATLECLRPLAEHVLRDLIADQGDQG